ncbi:MAG: hypothetical protein P0S96_00180 [Simkaniaceae bacterium]|nr:hypothetical protein [Candidatus Sacchlamyda saccharinae]
MTIEIEIDVTPAGKEPYTAWEKKLSRQVRATIAARIARLRLGNFGDCKTLANTKGLYELRIHLGAGYRIYFGKKKKTIILFLYTLQFKSWEFYKKALQIF